MILKVTDAFSDRDLESSIVLVDTVQQDLGQCAGWDVSRISNITGGKLVGNVLEFEPMAEEVTYTYDCGYNCMLDVHLYIRLNEYPITYHLMVEPMRQQIRHLIIRFRKRSHWKIR